MIGFEWEWQLDGWIVAAGVLCAVSSSLLGCFLLLRKMSLLGDAISHAVLPGLAGAFLISGSRSSVWMFVGAVIVGVLTAVLSDFIHNRGQVDEGASMGVVFTTLFAAGLLMIVAAADRVDLDPGCVLYGAIEQTPLDQWTFVLSPAAEDAVSVPRVLSIPRVVVILLVVTFVNALFVGLFFKELKISTFDPALATASGFSASLIHYVLMTLVAITAVASFESVGNILVVAMLIVPPATAYLLTHRLGWMVVLSCLIGAFSAWSGHVMAIIIPSWFGFGSTTTAGMMSVATGGLFLLAFLFAPQQGLLPRLGRQQWLRWSILADDVLTLLYRIEEAAEEHGLSETHTKDWVAETLLTNRYAVNSAIRYQRWRGRVEDNHDVIDSADDASVVSRLPRLTELGRREAETLVRSHRLWEQYLVTKVDVAEERLHAKADRLEHFTNRDLQDQLSEQTDSPTIDPHGRTIPSPDKSSDR